MKTSEATKTQETNPTQNFSAALHAKFSGKNAMIAAAVLVSSSEAPPKNAGTTGPSATEGTRQIVA